MEVLGRLPWSSNATFLVELAGDGGPLRAIYKPGAGERPLWDYPSGLYKRERAVYLVSEILGWGLVPETVIRQGEFGEGSVQRFVDADFSEHYFSLLENARHHDALRTIALFDVVVNNGDRKGGHFLLGPEGDVADDDDDQRSRVWAIDHGLCLHEEPKLRTVAWDFAGRPLPAERLPDLERLVAQVAEGEENDGVTAETAELLELLELLDAGELLALATRAAALVERPVFPVPRSSRAYPWPLI